MLATRMCLVLTQTVTLSLLTNGQVNIAISLTFLGKRNFYFAYRTWHWVRYRKQSVNSEHSSRDIIWWGRSFDGSSKVLRRAKDRLRDIVWPARDRSLAEVWRVEDRWCTWHFSPETVPFLIRVFQDWDSVQAYFVKMLRYLHLIVTHRRCKA